MPRKTKNPIEKRTLAEMKRGRIDAKKEGKRAAARLKAVQGRTVKRRRGKPIPHAPIDPNVALPAAVARQANLANAFYKSSTPSDVVRTLGDAATLLTDMAPVFRRNSSTYEQERLATQMARIAVAFANSIHHTAISQ